MHVCRTTSQNKRKGKQVSSRILRLLNAITELKVSPPIGLYLPINPPVSPPPPISLRISPSFLPRPTICPQNLAFTPPYLRSYPCSQPDPPLQVSVLNPNPAHAPTQTNPTPTRRRTRTAPPPPASPLASYFRRISRIQPRRPCKQI